MKVGFYNTWRPGDSTVHLMLGDQMIRSVKRVMPGIEITQLTDEVSPILHGVDHVQKLPSGPLALMTATHYSKLEGDWLLVDTDVVIQRDVRHVFDDPDFDVAVASRAGTLLANEMNPSHSSGLFMAEMPYNIGVVFSRCPRLWAEVAEGVSKRPPKDQAWMANQRVACAIIRSESYRIRTLTPEYNYSPVTETEDVSARAIVHYKGPTRKTWMLSRFREGVSYGSQGNSSDRVV